MIRHPDPSLVVAASGLEFAAASAAGAGDTLRAIGLGLAGLALVWKAWRERPGRPQL